MSAERRELQFSSLDEVVADVEQLMRGEVRCSGNHSFPEIIRHLAITHDVTTGRKAPPPLPFIMRLMMPFIRGSVLKGPAKPGFNLPGPAENFFWPKPEMPIHEAFAYLKESVEYYKANGPVAKHPIFGPVTKEQMDSLNFSHGAMHLSFVHPA
ncbi:MAG: DUF1569 domain-containing protein [Planctomycetota bacterium]